LAVQIATSRDRTVEKHKEITSPDAQLNRLVARSGLAVLIGAVLLAALGMAYPIHFDARDDASFAERLVTRFETRLIKFDSLVDIPRNILLFLSFGFGLGYVLSSRKLRDRTTLVTVAIAGLGLSFAGETLQLWYAGQSSSLSDLVANGIGAMLGLVFYCQCGIQVLKYVAV
jgi:VanZ family protein